VQVEREVVREHRAAEDVFQQRALVLAHQDFVMPNLLVPAVGAEVDDEERHRVAPAGDAPVIVAAAEACRNELRVGVGEIAISPLLAAASAGSGA
jgi:hypothetical protein